MSDVERMAEFDRWWAGGEPDPGCPSCGGSGWATIRTQGITVAGGRCRCRGGTVWAAPLSDGEDSVSGLSR